MFRFFTIRNDFLFNQTLFTDVHNPLNECEAKQSIEYSYLEIVGNMGILCKQFTQTLYFDASMMRRNIRDPRPYFYNVCFSIFFMCLHWFTTRAYAFLCELIDVVKKPMH